MSLFKSSSAAIELKGHFDWNTIKIYKFIGRYIFFFTKIKVLCLTQIIQIIHYFKIWTCEITELIRYHLTLYGSVSPHEIFLPNVKWRATIRLVIRLNYIKCNTTIKILQFLIENNFYYISIIPCSIVLSKSIIYFSLIKSVNQKMKHVVPIHFLSKKIHNFVLYFVHAPFSQLKLSGKGWKYCCEKYKLYDWN